MEFVTTAMAVAAAASVPMTIVVQQGPRQTTVLMHEMCMPLKDGKDLHLECHFLTCLVYVAGMLELGGSSRGRFVTEAMLIGGTALLAGACIDRWGYGRSAQQRYALSSVSLAVHGRTLLNFFQVGQSRCSK